MEIKWHSKAKQANPAYGYNPQPEHVQGRNLQWKYTKYSTAAHANHLFRGKEKQRIITKAD
jgi:hypothetical protein